MFRQPPIAQRPHTLLPYTPLFRYAMSIRAAFTVATALAMTFAAAPAFASKGNTPPGNPCATGNGNPCTGNSGNSGQQGNAYRQAPTAIIIPVAPVDRSEEHTSELQSLMRLPYAVFCLKKKIN